MQKPSPFCGVFLCSLNIAHSSSSAWSSATLNNFSVLLFSFFLVTSVSALHAHYVCNSIAHLSTEQRRICRVRPESLLVVSHAVRLSLGECRYQFRNMRWNCSNTREHALLGHYHITGTYIHMIKKMLSCNFPQENCYIVAVHVRVWRVHDYIRMLFITTFQGLS